MTCVWEPDPSCLEGSWDDLPDDVKERSLLLATSSLITLTYGRVGTCPVTVRPCLSNKHACGDWAPRLIEGQWYNCSTCDTKCAPAFEIDLDGPVGYVESIKVDGQFLDLADWRLDDGHLLVWQGSGPSPIPTYQDLNKPDTSDGTWSITYSQSYPVAQDGRMAVAMLAMEFAKACGAKGKCSLPKGVTSVVRNGVSFSLDSALFPGGMTGIEVVDQYILKWAPAGAPLKNAAVFDPAKMMRAGYRRTSSVPTQATTSGFGQGGFGL